MSDECPLPIPPSRVSTSEAQRHHINAMLAMKRIAIVGLSDDLSKPSYQVASYLLARGKEIIPVNPNIASVFGIKAYATLEDIPEPVDFVDVFRKSDACAQVTQSAIAIGAKGVWLQSGIRNSVAKKLAEEAGIYFVEDRCLMVEHLSNRAPEDFAVK